MPEDSIPGLHHVTSICGAPQANLDFYGGCLGQRLVKKTVNFDAPDTYHLYYGDTGGAPGSIMTFFPFVNAGPGRAGPGMASAVAYAVPPAAFDGWMEKLALEAVDFAGPVERFGQRMIVLADPDGAPVELIEREGSRGEALDGFHSVTLWEKAPEVTARLLTDHFGYAEVGSVTEGGIARLRLQAQGGGRGSILDIIRSDAPTIARSGAGTIHHVAFRAETDEVQQVWHDRLATAGFDVTPVIDRQYFNAIYFHEPGGVLFEIATDPPGFANDEPAETMGQALMLPPQYEMMRAQIERVLPELKLRPVA
ncbi:ring-cleaving dioxygenase [Pseudooceanicola spongiae]|uniref:Ring-cleaving dioxygenase n=1 Tax=Pseudooceanicola spongiae TaxID=2613965 RepID=A0A7L9WIK0_9RHOB|nr:ring-cleaving dioxygenase [Pseudooceanicola spongiae]QOL79644.1 ring-cleaving dioxygenase [Pseudooceanicola spongiae]